MTRPAALRARRQPRRRAIRLGGALAALSVLSALPAAQGVQAPLFRAGVDLLSLEVTVVDGDGHPISGLTPDDFTVKIEGHSEPVSTVDFMRFGTAGGSEAAPVAPTTNTDSATQALRGGRVIVLLVDDLSERPGEGTELRMAAERFLSSLAPNDLVGMASTSGFGPVVSPTRDRALLVAALNSPRTVGKYDDLGATGSSAYFLTIPEAFEISALAGMPRNPAEQQAVIQRNCGTPSRGNPIDQCADQVGATAKVLATAAIHRAAAQIEAYREVIEALRAAPQPRVLIALTHGVALPVVMKPQALLDTVGRAAADADVRFYAVVNFEAPGDIRQAGAPRGSTSAVPQAPYDPQSAERNENNYLLDGMHSVTQVTGGEAFSAIGQADRFYDRINAETSGIYQLGVSLPANLADQLYLNVQVSVDRAGATVHAVPHALAPRSAPQPVSVEEAMRARLAQGGVAFGVPMTLGSAVRKAPSGSQLQVGVDVEVPASVDGPVTAMFAVIDATGKMARAGQNTLPVPAGQHDYRLSWAIPLPAGQYRLRFAVGDSRGNVGSVERTVVARLHRFGSVATSDLVTSWSRPNEIAQFLALDVLPASASTLGAILELYPDPGFDMGHLTVHVRLLTSEDPVRSTLVEEAEAVLATSRGTTSAAASFPAGPIVPGSYVLQAVVRNGSQDLGIVTQYVSKAR